MFGNSADCERNCEVTSYLCFRSRSRYTCKNIICQWRPGSRSGAFFSLGADRYVWTNTCGAVVVEEEDTRGFRFERTELNRRAIDRGGDVGAAGICDVILALIARRNVLDGIRVVALRRLFVSFALPLPQSPSSPDGIEKESSLGGLRGLNGIRSSRIRISRIRIRKNTGAISWFI